jgi:hypothetical protein
MSDKSLLVWGYRNELLKTLDDFILWKDILSAEELSSLKRVILDNYKKILRELKK